MFIGRLQQPGAFAQLPGQSTPVNIITTTSSQSTVEPQRASSSFWNNWDALAGGVPQDTLNQQQQQQQPFVDLGATQRWSQDGGWSLGSLLNGSQPGRGSNPNPNQARNSDRSRSARNFNTPTPTPTPRQYTEYPAAIHDDVYDDEMERYNFELGLRDTDNEDLLEVLRRPPELEDFEREEDLLEVLRRPPELEDFERDWYDN